MADFHITPIIRDGRVVDFIANLLGSFVAPIEDDDGLYLNATPTGGSLPFEPAAGDLLRTSNPPAGPEAFHNTNDHLADALCSEGSGFGHDLEVTQ